MKDESITVMRVYRVPPGEVWSPSALQSLVGQVVDVRSETTVIATQECVLAEVNDGWLTLTLRGDNLTRYDHT